MNNLAKIVDGKLVIEVEADMLEGMLLLLQNSDFISKEEKECDPETFENLTVLEDIDKFLPCIVDELNFQDEIGVTSVITLLVTAANKALDNGNAEGCDV